MADPVERSVVDVDRAAGQECRPGLTDTSWRKALATTAALADFQGSPFQIRVLSLALKIENGCLRRLHQAAAVTFFALINSHFWLLLSTPRLLRSLGVVNGIDPTNSFVAVLGLL